jgi:hypothetical protein
LVTKLLSLYLRIPFSIGPRESNNTARAPKIPPKKVIDEDKIADYGGGVSGHLLFYKPIYQCTAHFRLTID